MIGNMKGYGHMNSYKIRILQTGVYSVNTTATRWIEKKKKGDR